MNPAKRAKLEADLGRDSAEAVRAICTHFHIRILSLTTIADNAEARENQSMPSTVDIKKTLQEADDLYAPLAQTIKKHQSKLAKGEYVRLDLSALPALYLSLLRVQSTTPKSDKCPPALFASLLSQLEPLHIWTVAKLVEFGESFSADSLILFSTEIKDICEYCLQHDKVSVILPLLTWIWSPGPSKLFLDLRKSLGKAVVTELVKQFSVLKNALSEDDLLMTSLAKCILADTPGSAVPLSLAGNLFELLVDRLMSLCDATGSSPLLDTVMAKLVECLVSGSIASIPSYLSPRCPLVIRLVGMLSVFPHAGPLTLQACDEAQMKIEIAAHPVRPLPPVEMSVRIGRMEAVRASYVEAVEISAETPVVKNQANKPIASNIVLNFDSLQNSTLPQIDRPDRVHEQSRPVAVEEPAPEFISAPNLFARILVSKTAESQADAVDDEPLPDLFLD